MIIKKIVVFGLKSHIGRWDPASCRRDDSPAISAIAVTLILSGIHQKKRCNPNRRSAKQGQSFIVRLVGYHPIRKYSAMKWHQTGFWKQGIIPQARAGSSSTSDPREDFFGRYPGYRYFWEDRPEKIFVVYEINCWQNGGNVRIDVTDKRLLIMFRSLNFCWMWVNETYIR